MVVVYVGWKGLELNIISNVIVYFCVLLVDVIVWIGFVISGFCYEVDVELGCRFFYIDGVVVFSD